MLFSIRQLHLRVICNRKILDAFIAKPTTNLQRKCKYARWEHRKPIAIVNKNELFDDQNVNDTKILQRKRQSIMVRKIKSQKKVSPNEETLLDKESDKINNKKGWSDRIIKLKENDSITRSLMINVKSGKKRKKKDQILLEGYRLVKDGTEVGVKPKAILSSDIIYLTLYEDVKLFQIPYKTIQLWSRFILLSN
ncbi:hypothetical protein V1477_001566 [Vespula maculifrons]|uniref:Uncharacterized protein n=1 Tax=Vespula maculifrons TaxID=7453 RepID=A0ABD2CZK9_VESMC